jgi:hypothetical protein
MPNQKISELTAIVTVDNSVDVLPIVDISANTTKKVTPNALKTALALDNVNNTSDANKPVSIAQQDALNAKVDENAPITAGTAPKITYDAKGLVTSGDSLDETDLPTGINANKIGTGVVSTTEFEYLNGVTSAIQTQLNAKQATLVSGTNIKTINGATVLGAGDLTITGNPPSGVSGAIQFSNGSAFASDASNLFWDNTNKRLGVRTNAPSHSLEVRSTNQTDVIRFKSQYAQNGYLWTGNTQVGLGSSPFGDSTGNHIVLNNIGALIGAGGQGTATAKLQIVGSGSTSATTSLLVQNSAGTAAMTVRDDLASVFGGQIIGVASGTFLTNPSNTFTHSISGGNSTLNYFNGLTMQNADQLLIKSAYNGNTRFLRTCLFGADSTNDASSQVQIDSTTRGFLPPRMTTTQKNAIASPAAGLVLYDSTTNKLQCYNGSTWNDLF